MDKKKSDYYKQVISSNLINGKQTTCFKYILEYGPLTANEMIDLILENEGSCDAYDTMSWNKYPSQLAELNIIKVVDKRRCKSSLSKSATKAKVWGVTFENPVQKKKNSKKTLSLLEQAKNSALLAVEIYNKPTVKFKSEGYITLMMIAWTKGFHAYFEKEGIDYFSKDKKGNYILADDGEKRTWELSRCISEYDNFTEAIFKNLEIHIKLRNRIVHGSVDADIFDAIFFPECQSLLYNFENFMIQNFGLTYSINHSLAYSLQFSAFRTDEQNKALHQISSVQSGKLLEYLDLFRMQLKDEVFHSPEYGVKLISIPQVQNSGRRGVPIEFINWDSLDDYQKENLAKINAIIKTKKEIKEVSNAGKVRASEIIKKVQESEPKFNQHHFKCFCFIYSVRPYKEEKKKKHDVVEKLCAYDEVHNDYVYYPALADILIRALSSRKETIESLVKQFKNQEKKEIKKLLSELMQKIG